MSYTKISYGAGKMKLFLLINVPLFLLCFITTYIILFTFTNRKEEVFKIKNIINKKKIIYIIKYDCDSGNIIVKI